MKERILKFRHDLGLVFDDDLGTRQWYNIADWVIVFMILLSSVEIFLSTFNFSPEVMQVLDFINTFTLWFFVVEVTLRIWAAPEQNPAYRGLKGRIKYCFTFYGFIDWVSTYPFLIQFIFPMPLSALRILRTARIIRVMRITRYAKSFNLLSDSIREKRNELIVSLQFLVIITFILSLILFVYEHEAQPEVYDNGFSSVLWAFAQYIGDPGQFADTPPVTFAGKVIACVVGILGIAIFAVPAGILGAGFTETIEKEAHSKHITENGNKLRKAFERKLDRPTGYQAVPFFRTLADIQARLQMSCDDMIEACNSTPGFRLINLASTQPTDVRPHDRLAIEHFIVNRPYGVMIDRGSSVTIVSPSSMIDATVGIYSYYIALMGGFNYISREIGETAPYRSFYAVREPLEPGQAEYNADLARLLDRPGAWSFTILVASGANEPEYDTQFHFGTGLAKGSEVICGPTIPAAYHERYEQFYRDFTGELKERFDLTSDCGRYHSTASKFLWFRNVPQRDDAAHVMIRIAWSVMLWSGNRLLIARMLADAINRDILGIEPPEPDKELTTKILGFGL